MEIKYFIFIFIVVFCSTICQIEAGNVEQRVSGLEERKPKQTDIEDRAGYPGLTQILAAVADLFEEIVAFMLGQGSVDKITAAIQGVFFQMRRMISVQGIAGQIPVMGFVLQPLIGIAAMILSNAPMLGGVISLILVGPPS